ncbi:competence protein CoiA family protein [Streptomyces sp. NPDC096176]|uniref:competence protein CoiA family protein n=1 Tax=Streptomyces sp. NPDC096176 TaxID=3366079 RepID=UPI0037FD9BCF
MHRARPRVALACPECAHPVHAKVSPRGTRFFAHDSAAPTCVMAGESLEHHLLKLELATAIRAADHQAELEVRGPDGTWRADVLSSSLDGMSRMAWEAQLSPIRIEEIRQRTQRVAADGVGICWVSTRMRPWLGAVPSVVVTPPTSDDPDWQVVAGLARFVIEACDVHERPWQCPVGAHGHWCSLGITLPRFVGQVLESCVMTHRPAERIHWSFGSWSEVWSSRHHIADAERFGEAERKGRERQARENLEWRARRWPEANRFLVEEWQGALSERIRQNLHSAVAEWIRIETGKEPTFKPQWIAWDWACGVPVCVDGRPYGVVHPDPTKINWQHFSRLITFAATNSDRESLLSSAPAGARIVTPLSSMP